MRRARKGQTLVHVLITSVIVALIMAEVARMILARYAFYNRATVGTQSARYDTGAVNRLLSNWAATDTVCNVPPAYLNYTCKVVGGGTLNTTPPGTSNCQCCPADTTNDAALIFVSNSSRLCIESPTPNGSGSYMYQADNTSGILPACPNITCP